MYNSISINAVRNAESIRVRLEREELFRGRAIGSTLIHSEDFASDAEARVFLKSAFADVIKAGSKPVLLSGAKLLLSGASLPVVEEAIEEADEE